MKLDTNHLDGMSREALIGDLARAEDENSRLRELLLGMAARPEITAATRTWLATELKREDKKTIVETQADDDAADFMEFRKWVEKLVDCVRLATALPEDEMPSPAWYVQADALTNAVSGFLDWEPGYTISFLKKGK
jgi:hypothetical protein